MNMDQLAKQYKNRCFDLSKLGLLKVSGQDAGKFLQGQLSCDVAAILPGNSAMGAQCNPQGRVISLFYTVRIQDCFYLVMPLELINITIPSLKKYAVFFKTQIENATGEYKIIGVSEPQLKPEFAAEITIPSTALRSILLVTPDTAMQPDMASYDDWHMLDLLDGIPSLYPETSGKFLPHDLNLPAMNVINFDKGCFTGQEIIARMHYRGKPKNHLYRGLINARVMPGVDLIAQENPAGIVIDCSQTMYNNGYPVIFVTDEMTMNNQQLQTQLGQLIQPL